MKRQGYQLVNIQVWTGEEWTATMTSEADSSEDLAVEAGEIVQARTSLGYLYRLNRFDLQVIAKEPNGMDDGYWLCRVKDQPHRRGLLSNLLLAPLPPQ